jgi:multisubunit Na+/H+ antiporter MnhG subunit
MRDGQRGSSGMIVLGAIVVVLGVIAIAIAPSIMNEAEIGTLQKIGGGICALGVILLVVGLSKKKG